MSKKAVIWLSLLSVLIIAAALLVQLRPVSPGPVGEKPAETGIQTDGITAYFQAADGVFHRSRQGHWQPLYIQGVNMGLTQATTDLADPGVPYDTYREWFRQIAAMNANTVRAFTVMPPRFYTALDDHNREADTPLYLLQGIWFNENFMTDLEHAYAEDERIGEAFTRAARETVDIIHGRSDYTAYGRTEKAIYDRDVSPYTVGYILGLEWDPGFVQRTNALTGRAGWQGRYLQTTTAATPFESFLCRVGDSLIDYETTAYRAQTPVAFLNWQTTDTIRHTNEPYEDEGIDVDTETIRATAAYPTGLFAAVDVYPYYPEFMNHQPDYVDKYTPANPYRAYLEDLIGQYRAPVLVAEYGLPTSRGCAHQSVMDAHQGGLTEEEQGRAVSKMAKDIADTGYAGSCLFSWQDEWFKQTWNTVKYAPEDPARRTPNVQSAEQSYGILAMEPGTKPLCLIDGLDREWPETAPRLTVGSASVAAMWDEGYLYLCIRDPAFTFGWDTLLVPITVTGRGSTFSLAYDAAFAAPADFLLVIDSEENTRLLTDSRQDVFYYRYTHEKTVFPREPEKEKARSGLFSPIRQFLSNPMDLPVTGESLPPLYEESGRLTYGITDPDSPAFCSKADFYAREHTVEVRIPWYLLNVMNSTEGVCLGDFYGEQGIHTQAMPGVRVGLGRPDDRSIPSEDIGYAPKAVSEFHTRLKKSYPIIQKTMRLIADKKAAMGR